MSKIEDLLDHKILLCNEDEELLNLCDKHGWKYVVFEANPTCEIIAEFIYGLAKDYFAKNLGETIKVVSVRIEETCTTSCTYTN